MARRPANTPTIKDVAERAAVSIGTVSRVLNDFPDVAEPLRQRVQAAIRDLGYRTGARQEPDRSHTKAIGFLLCNGMGINTVHAHLLVGIEEYCSSQGYYTIFTRHAHAAEAEPDRLEIPEIFTSRQLADCTIVAGTAHGNFLEALEARQARYVLLANHAATAAAAERASHRVRYDDFRGFEEATAYLAQLGHRNIWYIGDTARPWFRSRHEGYLSGMRQHGLEPRAHTFAIADDPFENGQAIVCIYWNRSRHCRRFCADQRSWRWERARPCGSMGATCRGMQASSDFNIRSSMPAHPHSPPCVWIPSKWEGNWPGWRLRWLSPRESDRLKPWFHPHW
ncbi:MAG: LacI family DNA-binding transcriptional regulator [Paludibaculum sp.]